MPCVLADEFAAHWTRHNMLDSHQLTSRHSACYLAQSAPSGDEDAGQRQREQGGGDGGQAGGQIPVPRVTAVLRAAAGQDVELHKLPRDEYPSAVETNVDAVL